MNAVRQIYENLPGMIKTPAFLKSRRVEVIMLPLDGKIPSEKNKTNKNANPIDEFIGAWEGKPLTRPDQGEPETRELLK